MLWAYGLWYDFRFASLLWMQKVVGYKLTYKKDPLYVQ
jgi:hypothetical protein